jgi:hypothetical protein
MTRRAQDEVDLTYITPRTIAMSFPATGYEGDRQEHKSSLSRWLFSLTTAYLRRTRARLLARCQSLIATTSTTLLRCCGMPQS